MKKRQELLGQMSGLLENLMEQGKIKKYDATALGSLIFGMLHSIVMGSVVFDDVPLKSYKETAASLLRRALIP